MISPSTSPDLDLATAQFRDLMACWPSGVAVVTGSVEGRPVGCTATAVASVSAQPPLLLVSLAASSRTLFAIRRTGGRFGVCVLSSAQRALAQRFARGDPVERFAGVSHVWQLGVPVLRDTVVAAVCAVRAELAVADHVLVVGGPQRILGDLRHNPAIWFQRAYWELCPTGAPVR
jgi:3-hydroxy-9,10-secoandrosta-1,3,5(10)-triene-9,17-dione monooxygenase reductase component